MTSDHVGMLLNNIWRYGYVNIQNFFFSLYPSVNLFPTNIFFGIRQYRSEKIWYRLGIDSLGTDWAWGIGNGKLLLSPFLLFLWFDVMHSIKYPYIKELNEITNWKINIELYCYVSEKQTIIYSTEQGYRKQGNELEKQSITEKQWPHSKVHS